MAREKDQLDRMLDDWRRARPETDVRAMDVIPRLFRLAYFYDRELGALTRSFGLKAGWVDVLSALRRAGEPFRLSASRLARSVLLTSGGMTGRLDRMEGAGLVRRLPDPDDRRGVLVELTDQGRETIEAVIDAQSDLARDVLAPLTKAEQDTFVRLLRKQILAFERDEPEGRRAA